MARRPGIACAVFLLTNSQDWLKKMVRSKDAIWPHLVSTYGKENPGTWYNRWQVFHLACSELFAHEGGDTWGVTHLLFEKTDTQA